MRVLRAARHAPPWEVSAGVETVRRRRLRRCRMISWLGVSIFPEREDHVNSLGHSFGTSFAKPWTRNAA